MGLKIFQVDAFTDRPFSGNPAAVCILTEPKDDRWLKDVAREMNLSETAFVLECPDGFSLRWFTPTVEVDLCGHATLAAAHILWEAGIIKPATVARFFTRSGLLTAVQKDNWIEMDFPAEPEERVEAPELLTEALSAPALYVGKNRFDYLAELPSEEAVRSLCPDLSLLKRLPARGVIVTSRAKGSAKDSYDFVSRFFAPGTGIDEDPVTGSAHCCLGPFWGKRLNKKSLIGYQASERGGVVKVNLKESRVLISGQAVTVLRGELA